MKLEGEQTLLRVYLRNTDRHGWSAAADALVARARKKHLAGATVLRGVYGLDAAGDLLKGSGWLLVEHIPVIVEFVDRAHVIGAFLHDVAEIVAVGLATLERAHVLVYRRDRAAAKSGQEMRVPAAVVPLSTLPSAEEFPIMKTSEEGQLLRVFFGEADVWEGEPLYRAIVLKAKELGLAGATVLRGPMGFGAHGRVHSANLLDVSTDLPAVVEVIDTAEKIQLLLPFLDQCVVEGLITLEAVRIIRYRV